MAVAPWTAGWENADIGADPEWLDGWQPRSQARFAPRAFLPHTPCRPQPLSPLGLLSCCRFVSLQGPEMTDEENHRLFRRVISASEPPKQASARPRCFPAGAFRTGSAAGAFGPEFVWRWGRSPSQIPLSMTSRHRRSASCTTVSGSIPPGSGPGSPMHSSALFLRVRPLRIAREREADRRPSGLSSVQLGYRRDCTVLSDTGVRAVRGLLAVAQS